MDGGGRRNWDIEVLRALAVSLVVSYHAWGFYLTATGRELLILNAPSLGGAGVQLFFVVSGFVIGRTLFPSLQGRRNPRDSAWEAIRFWVRRAFRLLPTAWLWLALILALTVTFSFQDPMLAFAPNLDAAIAGVFYFANFRFLWVWGEAPYGASFHYWSLALEEQFYALLPLVVLISGRLLTPVLIALILIDQLTGVPTTHSMTGPLLGALIAIWSQTRSYQQLRAAAARAPTVYFVVLSALGVFATIFFLSSPLSSLVGARAAALGAAALVVLIASFDQSRLTPGGVMGSVLLWIGSRSYALYVIHVPLFLVLAEILAAYLHLRGLWALGVLALAMAALLTLAEINYRFVEQPLRAYGARLSNRLGRQTAPVSAHAR